MSHAELQTHNLDPRELKLKTNFSSLCLDLLELWITCVRCQCQILGSLFLTCKPSLEKIGWVKGLFITYGSQILGSLFLTCKPSLKKFGWVKGLFITYGSTCCGVFKGGTRKVLLFG